MRIVLGASHFPPSYLAGVEIYTYRLARWLVSHGHSVEVVCVEQIDASKHLSVQTDLEDGVVVHRLGLKLAETGQHLGLRYRDDQLGEWFAKFLTRTQPDLFHSHSCYLLSASTLEAARSVAIPTVVTLHDSWFFCPRINLVRSNGERCAERATAADCTWCLMAEQRRYRLVEALAGQLGRNRAQGQSPAGPLGWPLDRRLLEAVSARRAYLDRQLRSVDQIVILGRLAHDLLAARREPPAKVRLIPSGLDLSRWRGLAHTPREGALRIGYLGQLAPHKGVHLLVQAFQRLCARAVRPQLAIFGDERRFPAYVDRLRRLAGGNSDVRFCGRYEPGEVEDILSQIDVVVIPSVCFETRPVVMLEAFAARVPVIASRLPNMQFQVQDEVHGLLFAPGDAEDLRRQLQRIVDEPDLLGRLAQKIPRVRTLDQEMLELEGVYRAVVADPRNSSSVPSAVPAIAELHN